MKNHFGKWIKVGEKNSKVEREKLFCEILTKNGFRSSLDFPSCAWFDEILDLRNRFIF